MKPAKTRVVYDSATPGNCAVCGRPIHPARRFRVLSGPFGPHLATGQTYCLPYHPDCPVPPPAKKGRG